MSKYRSRVPTKVRGRKWTSVAKVYADVNLTRPASFWEYNEAEFDFRTMEDYMLLQKLGRGKYSEVFLGLNKTNGQPCAVKVLKPIKTAKIQRELLILQAVSGGPNIIQILDMCRDPATGTTCFVFEYVDNEPFETLYPQLSDLDIRYYLYELLRALDYCHSQGVMHRDVKPHNVMIDPKKRTLRLIDWGLAEFYHKGEEYNVRVASRFFKSPALLAGIRDYDHSLDMWSVGCMLASLVFKKEPFFKGADLEDQLVKIVQVLGLEGLLSYLDKYECKLSTKFNGLIPAKCKRLPWTSFINSRNKDRVNDDAIDLIDKLLQYDHQARPSAAEAMEHPYFAPIRPQRVDKERKTKSLGSQCSLSSSTTTTISSPISTSSSSSSSSSLSISSQMPPVDSNEMDT